MSGIVAGGGFWLRFSVGAESRPKAEAQVPPLSAAAGLVQRLDRRMTVWLIARSLEKRARPSRRSLY